MTHLRLAVGHAIMLAMVGCAAANDGPPSTSRGRPTDAEIKAATDELRMLRLTVFLERYQCVSRRAFIDAARFREMPIDRKTHLAHQLMRACEISPEDGSFTLLDDRNGQVLMTFDRGTVSPRE